MYAIITGIWVISSDRLLVVISRDPDSLTALQTYKGLAFIVLTSALLYTFSLRELRVQARISRALAAHEAQSRLVTSQMPSSILWATDAALRITQLSGGWSGRVGQEEAVLNHVLRDVFPVAEQPGILEAHLRALQGDSTTLEMRQDEDIFEVRVEPLRGPEGTIVGCVGLAVRVTERKLAEAAAKKQHILNEALRHTATVLTNTLDPAGVMERILATIGSVVPHETVSIMLVEDGAARHVAARGYSGSTLAGQPESISLDTQVFKEMYETQSPLLIPDTVAYEHQQGVQPLFHPQMRSYAGAPLIAHGQVVGFLNMCSETPGFFSQDHFEALRLFAAQASIALENARLYRQIEDYARELEDRVAARTAEVQGAKDRVEAIVNSSSDVIILADLNHHIVQFNAVFRHVFACDAPHDFVGSSLVDLVVHEHVPFFEDALQRLVAAHTVQRVEVAVRCDGSARFDADAVLSPVLGSDQTLEGIVCSLRDITERKQSELRLRETLHRAVELNEVRARFVSIASHEFRNPLAAIQTSADLLRRYNSRMTDSQKEEEVQRIRGCVKQLTGLLDDLLTLGAVEAGRLKFEPENVDLQALTDQLVAEIRQTIGVNHRLDFKVEGRCDCLFVDPRLYRYVVNNLLSNAFKYSPSGSTVHLVMSCRADTLVLVIADEGIGILPEDQARLFEAFHRGSNVGSVQGTGLGMVIIGQAINVHGGTIAMESRENEGTVFTVTLPAPAC
jgi:PAS domain S-box-containing protein